jgi:hypothetical protein
MILEKTCLNCNKALPQTEGKRAKQFCNSTCRSNYWQKEKRKNSDKSLTKVAAAISLAALPANKRNKDKVPPKKEVSQEAKTGFKTLDELKATCPENLKGIDRSIWISEQRVKYNV